MSNLLFETKDLPISALIEELKNGKLALPRIQRGYVWQPWKIPYLFDSLYRGFPVNSMILWKVSKQKLEEASIARNKNIQDVEHLLLDGQQRVTSIALGFLGKLDNVIGTGGKKLGSVTKQLMFNLEHTEIEVVVGNHTDENIVENEDTQNNGNEEDKNNLKNNIFALYSPKMSVNWVKMEDIYDKYKESSDIIPAELKNAGENKIKSYKDKIIKVKKILDINIPSILLKEEIKYEQATEIFTRINAGGVKLSGTDLALAILALKWDTCTDEFTKFLDEDNNGKLGKYGIDYLTIIRQLAMVATDKCKYNELEHKSVEDIKSAFETTKVIFTKVYDVLTNSANKWHVDNLSLLSSRYPFYMLCYLKHHFSNEFANNLEKLRQWFFCANAFGFYSASSESTLQEDMKTVIDNKSKGLEYVLQKFIEKNHIKAIDAKFLSENSKTSNTIFKMLYFVQKNDDCKDWLDGVGISYDKVTKGYNYNVHHIFPKKTFEGKVDDNKINDIANLTFITFDTNQKIKAKLPSEYFHNIDGGKSILTEDKQKGHYIPIDNPKLFELANYEEFLEERRKLMADAINNFLCLSKA
jgi:hypothetical protein